MRCVNLKNRFGKTYRIEYEESYEAEHGSKSKVQDSWLMTIPCKHGHICPYGGKLLMACTNRSGKFAGIFRRLPNAIVHQDGEDGTNVIFDAADFKAISRIMKPIRKKQMSQAQKQAATERLKRYHQAKAK